MLLSYRKDIDGLRALSVFAVMIYHADLQSSDWFRFQGGYLGVDVFFVVSGYLITQVILKDVDEKRFSLLYFFSKRLKRLLPLSLFVAICSSVLAYILFLPDDLLVYSKSLLASLFFIANVFFWQYDSYTADALQSQPLLHMWSLSLEEQFYLFFSFFILGFSRFGFRVFQYGLFFLLLISLSWSVWSNDVHSDAVFYLMPFRFWEFSAGGLLGAWCYASDKGVGARAKKQERYFSCVLFFLGVLLIFIAFKFFHDVSPIPVMYNLVAVLGAMLVIFSRFESRFNFLSFSVLAYLGVLSYGLYLWHFPVFVFLKYFYGVINVYHFFIYFLITFFLAFLSYYIVEKPFRFSSKKRYLGISILMFVSLLMFSLLSIKHEGMPDRLGDVKYLFAGLDGQELVADDVGPCHNRDLDDYCYFNEPDSDTLVALVGDSHAGAISLSAYDMATRLGYGYVQFTEDSCAHLMFLLSMSVEPSQSRQCNQRAHKISAFLDEYKHKKVILIYSARLVPLVQDLELMVHDFDGGINEAIKSSLKKWVKDNSVLYLVYPIPEMTVSLPYQVAMSLRGLPLKQKESVFSSLDLSISYSEYLNSSEVVSKVFDDISENQKVVPVRSDLTFCSYRSGRCETHSENKLYYYDNNHLSVHGASKLMEDISGLLLAYKHNGAPSVH